LAEDTVGSVRCNAKFEDVAAEEDYTLKWYDENDVMVSTNQNNGDYQIVGGSSTTEETAYLFVSGRGNNFTENNLTIIFATLQTYEVKHLSYVVYNLKPWASDVTRVLCAWKKYFWTFTNKNCINMCVCSFYCHFVYNGKMNNFFENP